MIFLVMISGLVIGSFLNVVIYRVPLGKSILYPPSQCTACGKPIRWYMNIPVVSYLFLRGKCAYCKAPVSWIYPSVELFTGGLFLGSYLLYGNSLHTVTVILFVLSLFVTSLIDLKHFIIPWEVLVPTFLWGIYIAVDSGMVWEHIGSFFICGSFILSILFVGKLLYKKDVMGGGDVYYAAFIGFFLTFRVLPLFFLVSFLIGAISGLIFSVYAKKKLREHIIPFGPFLSIGGLTGFFFGEIIVDWYYITFLGGL